MDLILHVHIYHVEKLKLTLKNKIKRIKCNKLEKIGLTKMGYLGFGLMAFDALIKK